MEGTGLLLRFRMTLMRLEEERVEDVFMMILCVCLLLGGSGCMDSVDCMLMFEYVDLGVLGNDSRLVVMLSVYLLIWNLYGCGFV